MKCLVAKGLLVIICNGFYEFRERFNEFSQQKKCYRYKQALHVFLDYDTFLAHPLRSVILKAIY